MLHLVFFRMSLSRCCNAPSFLFTTKRNTPAGTKLRYEVDTSGILPITTEIFKMFPDVSSLMATFFPSVFFSFHILMRCVQSTNYQKLHKFIRWTSVSSRTCHIPNHSSKNVLLLETVASSRTANVEKKSIHQILFSGIKNI